MEIIHLTNEGFDNVIQENKYVMIEFWGPWCTPCKMMESIIDEINNDYGDKIKIAKVNVDDCNELATIMKIMTVPAFIFYKDGIECNRIIGSFGKSYIITAIKELIRN